MSKVPVGYKQTEVGVIPEDWEVKSLGIISTIATGNTPPTNDTTNYGDDFLFVSPLDLGYMKYISHTEKMLSKKGFAISRHFPKNSVLFVCIGSTIGKCGIASKELASNQQINAIFPSPVVSTDYIYYSVCASALKIKSLAGEQAVPIVNKTQFSETIIPLPPTKAEQEAIAEALSDTDALIESLEQLIAKKRHLKQGAMQELLTGKKRLPGFSGAWEIVPLGSLINSLDSGVSVNSVEKDKDIFAHDESILKTSCVIGGKFIPEEHKQILPSDIHRAKLNPRKDSIIFSRMNTPALVGECGYVDRDYPNLFIPDRLWMARFGGPYSTCARWLAYLLSFGSFNQAIKETATGTSGSMKNISQGSLLSVHIPLPTEPEQTAIAAILSAMDAEIAALETKLAKTRQLKQGMMHNLLTGKIRLFGKSMPAIERTSNQGEHLEGTR